MNKENKNFMIFFKISNFSERRVTGKNWSADQIGIPKFCNIFEVNYFLSSYLLKRFEFLISLKGLEIVFQIFPFNFSTSKFLKYWITKDYIVNDQLQTFEYVGF